MRVLQKWLGLDSAVTSSLAARGWSFLSGPVTSLLIVAYFSREYQGYHYTFLNIAVATHLIDLGMSTAVQQFAAHEWAKYKAGSTDALSRLVSLGRFSYMWAAGGAVVLFVTLYFGGSVVMSRTVSDIDWRGPWTLMAALIALDFIIQYTLALLEGCGQVAGANAIRLTRSVVSSVAIWLAITGRFNLWAAPVSIAAGMLAMALLLLLTQRRVLALFVHKPVGAVLSWRRELAPLQWRMAVASVGAYFTTGIFVPIIFYFHGPVVAGRWGLTWTLNETVLLTAAAWLQVAGTRMGGLVATGRRNDLDRMLSRVLGVSLVVAAMGGAAILGTLLVVSSRSPGLAERVLSLGPTVLIIGTGLCRTVVAAQAMYFRAHKTEPLMLISVAGGTLTVAGSVAGAYLFGAMGVAAAYSAVTCLLLLPVVSVKLRRFRTTAVSKPAPTSAPS
jgi:O-antigen/teichoic acid export membrane protein